jgi:hypothetical protein
MMLPAGSLEAGGVPPLPDYRPVKLWVHYSTSCKHSVVLMNMGKIIAPKHLELIGIINKPLLLHLVACL